MKNLKLTKKEWRISILIHSLLLGLAFFPFLTLNQEKEEALQIVVLDFTKEIPEPKKETVATPVEVLAAASKKDVVEEKVKKETRPKEQKADVVATKPKEIEAPVTFEVPVEQEVSVPKEIVVEEKIEDVITEEPILEEAPIEEEVIEEIPVTVEEEVIEEVVVEEAIKEVEEHILEDEPSNTNVDDVELSTSDEEAVDTDTELTEVIDEGEANSDVSDEDTGDEPGSGFIEGDGVLSRPIIFRNDPKNLAIKSGTIVVKVCINRKGMVSYAEFDNENSTIHDPEIKKLVMADVVDYRFEKSYSAPEKECGRLSYHFKFNK